MNYKKNSIRLIISFTLALCWVIIANKQYNYTYEQFNIFQIPIFPIIGWTLGLFISIIFFEYTIIKNIKKESNIKIFFYFLITYWVLLILAETIGYHIFGVTNYATAQYSGLPICDCLHAPTWMKIAYFCIGPIYYISLRFIEQKK